MAHDLAKKHQYEHEQAAHKQQRAEKAADDALNADALHSDNHTGQEGILGDKEEARDGSQIKAVYEMLPDWQKDELRRLTLVTPGTRLQAGDVFCDLRTPDRGELVAHGEEQVCDELLVAKRGTDYEIWNKLLRKPTAAPVA